MSHNDRLLVLAPGHNPQSPQLPGLESSTGVLFTALETKAREKEWLQLPGFVLLRLHEDRRDGVRRAADGDCCSWC